jgi:hypothetical protein
MANLTISGGVWKPGNHRHHHTGSGGDYFDVSTVPSASGAVHADAQEHEENKTFLFWSWSGATETTTSTDNSVWVTYPDGAQPATLTRWYLPDSEVPGPQHPGVYFDALSLESGDFLDWGDTFDPFTVSPDAARSDDFASSSAGPVSVSADGVWPGGGPLVFSGWLIVRGAGAEHANELSEAQGGSAIAIATYARPDDVPRPIRDRIPPFISVRGDASLLSRELAQLGNINELTLSLADAEGRAAIQAAVMRYVGDLAQAQLKQLSSKGGVS